MTAHFTFLLVCLAALAVFGLLYLLAELLNR